MRILVDADAAPIKKIVVSVAKEYQLEVIMFFDTSHQYEDGYSKVIIVDQGRDAVDFALVNEVQKEDIVVTQDYGVATMALAKKAFPINPNGLIFTNDNIDTLLHSRFTAQKLRKAKVRLKGPKKRTEEDDERFYHSFMKLIQLGGMMNE